MRILAGIDSVSIKTHDSMIIAGGILPANLKGQEGELRASAVVLRQQKDAVCIISCDNLMMDRKLLDYAATEIEKETGIPFNNILICATHTHHAPSMMRVHGYSEDEEAYVLFGKAIKNAAVAAAKNCEYCFFHVSSIIQNNIGQNSRLLLDDKQILWIPQSPEIATAAPTGPYDPELVVFTLIRVTDGKLAGAWFNHSCHNIGSISGKRSPGFYGMAAQELEKKFGGTIFYIPGAAGSTHDFTRDAAMLTKVMKNAVGECIKTHIAMVPDDSIANLHSIKEEFAYTIRYFDEEEEEKAVNKYCSTMDVSDCGDVESVPGVFRNMRKELKHHQGKKRKSWLQIILFGGVAFVGLPGEVFASLGVDIKKRSPFDQTVIVELSNDCIGYIPDEQAYKLGGYQLWTGFHSFLPAGMGEKLVDRAVVLLNSLYEN